MKIKFIALTAILLTLLLGSASALPNLKLSWIEYSPNSERIIAEVINDSDEGVEDFLVVFFVDGEFYDSTLTEEKGLSIDASSRMTVYTDFPNDNNTHQFFASVDPQNKIEESNEADNTVLTEQVDWGRPGQARRPAVTETGDDYGFLAALAGLVGLIAVFAIFLSVKRMRRKPNE